MLIKVSVLKGLPIAAKDDPIGSLQDIFFDGENGRVHWLTVGIGWCFVGRPILLGMSPPPSFDRVAAHLLFDLPRLEVKQRADDDMVRPDCVLVSPRANHPCKQHIHSRRNA